MARSKIEVIRMKGTDDKTRTDNTAFPYSEIADEFSSEAVEAWTRRCMADYPEPYPIYVNDHTKEILHMVYDGEALDAWKKKWFSQFEVDHR